MKKQLLFLLFIILAGVSAAWADDVTINVDKAANIVVTTGSGTPVKLVDGMNVVNTLTSADNPLTIAPASGATIESVKKDNVAVTPSGDGMYRLSIGNMTVDITTSGEGGEPVEETLYDVMFAVPNFSGNATVTYDDLTFVLEHYKSYKLPVRPVTIAAAEGFRITSVDYDPDWTGTTTAVDNGDGTWSFTPMEYNGSMVTVNLIEEGIIFKVETTLASNVKVYAFMDSSMEWNNLKSIDLIGYNSPFTAVAPVDAYCIGFGSPDGGEIKSITRIKANGDKDDLKKSEWKGWASNVEEGDTFVINAVGPEEELTIISNTESISVDRFVVSVNDVQAKFTAENPVIKAHAGEIITVGGSRGVVVTNIYADCGKIINANGPVGSFMITHTGFLTISGAEVSDISIDVDNAKAVVVKDRNGYGEVLDLIDGNNVMTNVSNPLNITPAPGFVIKSVVLDGEVLRTNPDGSYTAAIEEGSTLVIRTAEKPANYPVTISITGEYEWLNVAVDGEPVVVTLDNNLLMVEPGAELTFSPVKGYLIKDLQTSANVLFASYNADEDVWTVTANGAGSVLIDMEKWVPAEGSVLIDYSIDRQLFIGAAAYDKKGEWYCSLAPGLNEIPSGYTLQVKSYSSTICLEKVLYNDVAMPVSEDEHLCTFTISEGGSVKVTSYSEEFTDVTGYSVSHPVNHAIIGYIYINKVGQLSYNAKPGEKITILPTPSPGYKFAGFSKVTPASCMDLISPEAPYELTVPEGLEYIIIEGNFVKDEEHPSYVVHTYLCYVDGLAPEDMAATAFVRLSTNPNLADQYANPETTTNDALVAEGDQVKLFCFVSSEDMQCVNFCLFTQPEVVIPQIYTVNGAHANIEEVIEISAYVVTGGNIGAAEEIEAEAYFYDATTAILHTPEAGKIYTLGGQVVKAVSPGTNDLSALTSGIYVVVTPAGTLKIAK